MLLFSFCLFILACTSVSYALPNPQSGEYGPDPTPDSTSILVENPVSTVISLLGRPSDAANGPDLVGLGEPIEGTSFFWISSDCYSDTRDISGSGFPNRGKFYEQAYKDATSIADQAQKWPQYGLDASDTYFGLDTEGDSYAPDIIANIKAAAEWDHPRFGFDNYIVLTCDDPYGACDGQIGDDTSPFFTTSTIDEQFENNKNVDPTQLDLRYLQTSGSFLLHEMFHTLEITGTNGERPHIIDLTFDGRFRRRIYGPKDVALAAKSYGPQRTTLNADSYAQFASAMFWKDIFGELPQPSTSQVAPENWTQLITDNDLNYIDQELPDPAPVCAGTPSTNPSVLQPYAQAQISTFCSYLSSQNVTIDSESYKYNPIGYTAGDSEPQSDNDLWLSVSFDPICNVNTTYAVNVDDCNFFLSIALNGCNTDTTSAKYGGAVTADCAIWNMTTRFGHNDEPPNGFPG
ncbi:hypothetical protein EG329_006907 [Mollisiaceae sp. DMI_Dod_QoI]|nr:hypothetical protein EG329_006907 [Helotiales sp. DMI_Dod_QoI]